MRFRVACAMVPVVCALGACKRTAASEQEPRVATSVVAGLSDYSSIGEVHVAESSGLEQPLEPIANLGRCAVTAADSWTVLELRSGARFKIEPSSRACVLNYAPKSLFVIEGSVVAEVPSSSSVEVRVITDHGTLVVSSGGQVWIAQQHAVADGTDALGWNASTGAPARRSAALERMTLQLG